MDKKTKRKSLLIFIILAAALFIGTLFTEEQPKSETIKETMRDAVLHESMKIRLFGLNVNPGLVAAFTVTGILLIICLIIRFAVIPRFRIVPGKVQIVLEEAVGFFENLAKTNSPRLNGFLGAYIFTAGAYIFMSTLFELLGLQVIATSGASVSLPAPLSDINGAISLGVASYLVILSGGIISNKGKGVLKTLKEFSLPISMSFRLFGALPSGALVTELVYYSQKLSYGLPVLVGVLFTLLHALIQTYVLAMLTSVFYGEVSEKAEPKPKKAKKRRKTK